MKINKSYSDVAYIEAVIKKKEEELQKKGYLIDHSSNHGFDLLAEKDNKKTAYEFKFRDSTMRSGSRGNVRNFIASANEIEADPVIIYVDRPDKVNVEFEDLGQFINEFLSNDIPDELDCLSTHTQIEEVYIEKITTVRFNTNSIFISGEATIEVSLQYGSDRDNSRGDGMTDSDSFPMLFETELSWDKKIRHLDYNINVDDFYE